jgi:hypothetical protein
MSTSDLNLNLIGRLALVQDVGCLQRLEQSFITSPRAGLHDIGFTRRSLTRILLIWGGLLLLVDRAEAQNDVLYSDWIDSVDVAKAHGDLRSAQHYYHAAFRRHPALIKHAIDCARVGWMLKDTSDVQAYVDRALDLGASGDILALDSVLNGYWGSTASAYSHVLWAKYQAMELPELKAELEQMFEEDQGARRSIDWEKADSPDSLVRRSVWAPIEALDEKHTARVIEIIREHGIPGVHQVGLTGNKMIFFAFIHASDIGTITDHVLLLSASVRKGDSPACWYAYVIDRIMVMTSKETMFGTTGYTDPRDGVTYFTSVVWTHTDLLREAMGLPRSSKGRSFY